MFSSSSRQLINKVKKFSQPILPLQYFVNKSKSLSLYRQFIRSSRGLGDRKSRWETILWVRSEFERYTGLVDVERSKVLLALGHRQLKQMNSTGMLVGFDGAKWRGMRETTPEKEEKKQR